jgi:hypothetical protein
LHRPVVQKKRDAPPLVLLGGENLLGEIAVGLVDRGTRP